MDGETNKKTLGTVFLCASTLIVFVLLFVLISQMVRLTVLPVKYNILIVLGILFVFVIGIFLTKRKHVALKAVGVLIVIVAYAINVEAIYLYTNSVKAINTIANQTTETTTYGIYVLATSAIETVEQLDGKTVGVVDGDADEELVLQLKDYKFNQSSYDSQLVLVEDLINDRCDGAVLNTAYVSMLEDSDTDEDAGVELKLLDEISVSKVVEARGSISSEEPFIVYISGKDTWGHISLTSRSDVNILAVVNPGTKHILLVSTPRDYYVPLSISNGVKDKLTHAGIYGVEVSEDTMEMLYDIKIDHYFKVNFSGFEGLIDAMGGITVWSDYDFDVERIGHFSKGENHLTGLQALAFVRERHSFSSGDVQRGENQMNVIQSVIQKMTSKSTLLKYSEIMEECDGTFATDISTAEIVDLVSYQLENPGDWNIEKMSVGGTGEHNSVYSLGKRVYVMNPNEDDVNNAKERIKEVLEEK